MEMKKLKLKVNDMLAAGAQQLAETIKGEVELEELEDGREESGNLELDSHNGKQQAQARLLKQRKEERQLAKVLGPVHGLFGEGPNNPDKSSLYQEPPLKPYVKVLPEGAMEKQS